MENRIYSAHAIKREILGRNTPISQYDLFYDKSTGAIFVLKKGASEVAKMATGYIETNGTKNV